jgi:hypothetical protein
MHDEFHNEGHATFFFLATVRIYLRFKFLDDNYDAKAPGNKLFVC